MLSIDEALREVRQHTPQPTVEVVRLCDAHERVLAADVRASVDSPPFAKSMMDGFAVAGVEVTPGLSLPVVGEIAAGASDVAALADHTAVRIMTGAPVPPGAQTVVPVEVAETEPAATKSDGESNEVVRFQTAVRSGANTLPQGEIAQTDDPIVGAGHRLGAGQIAALAEFGVAEVSVFRRPRVAILATGNELVPVDVSPGPGQIRNSNGPMLASLARELGAEPEPLGIARDDVEELDRLIAKGLEADILLLSGGVSAGKYDLVPDRLAAAGVQQVFHKVAIKPGKPIWFGRTDTTLVFGLPGNPVSSLVCGRLFAGAAIGELLGGSARPVDSGTLVKSHRQKGDRTTYWPSQHTLTNDGLSITPLPWKGSADLVRVAEATCWAVFPPGDREFGIGESIDVLLDSPL